MSDSGVDQAPSGTELLRLSEVFDSLQGEGVNAGKPCRFVRLALCNLHCHYCDTKYTWDFERFDYDTEVRGVSVPWLADQIGSAPARHVVVTGGAPLRQQRALAKALERVPADVFPRASCRLARARQSVERLAQAQQRR